MYTTTMCGMTKNMHTAGQSDSIPCFTAALLLVQEMTHNPKSLLQDSTA